MNVSYTKKAGLPGIKWKSDPYSLTLHGSLLLGDSGVVNMLQQYSACKGSLSEWIKIIFLYSSSSVSGEGLKVKVNSFHMRHKGQQTPQGQCWSLYLHWSIKASRSITETHTHTKSDSCVARRPHCCTGVPTQTSTNSTLNYFILIRLPALGSNDTHREQSHWGNKSDNTV